MQQAQAGFSLVETLVALLVVVMLTGLVAASLPVAWRTWQRVQQASNAQIVVSTAASALRGELELATQVAGPTSPGALFSYTRPNGDEAELIDKGDGSGFVIVDKATGAERPLVPTSVLDYERQDEKKDLMLQGTVSFDAVERSFKVTLTVENSDGAQIASIGKDGDPYVIRSLAEKAADDG